MKRALELAAEAMALGEVPVGCVIFRGDAILGEGRNRREHRRDALAHAETEAIRQACRAIGGWRLTDCVLCVTLEPCAMCAGAIANARIPAVHFGAADHRFGAYGGLFDLREQPLNHIPEVWGGLLAGESTAMLQGFFDGLRRGAQRASAVQP
jgi:tRNA(adenine34) deaminase